MRRPAAGSCTCTLLFSLSLVLGCSDQGAGRDPQSSASAGSLTNLTGLTSAPGSSSDGSSDGASSEATSSATSNAEGSASDPLKFDVGQDSGGLDTTTGQPEGGCQKIDFLFVVDNSASMADEQQSLANSFDGFISSIQNTVMAEDYHIMVIDTDAGNAFLQECFVLCAVLPECQGYPCNMLPVPMGCDASLGTGLLKDPSNKDCGITGGHRFMVDGQPNLASTFECVAKVGTSGDGTEKPMEAMVTSVTALNGPGQCNEGFLRKDALLVVTFITDEEDDGKSSGSPLGWKAGLVAAKYGVESSIVVLGLLGDPDQPNPVCLNGQAEASPNLRSFAESFPFGSWGSICSPDYAPFFDAAVSVIDTACQQFEPPG